MAGAYTRLDDDFLCQEIFREATELYGQVLETRAKALGAENLDVLGSMQNLRPEKISPDDSDTRESIRLSKVV